MRASGAQLDAAIKAFDDASARVHGGVPAKDGEVGPGTTGFSFGAIQL
jgi:hypothetical protein